MIAANALSPDLVATSLEAVEVTEGWESFGIEPLPEHASNRRYFRLVRQSGSGGPATLLVMKLAPEAFRSEEISGAHETPVELPFVEVGAYLESAGLPVPHVYFYDRSEGLVYLEDLGSLHFEEVVQGLAPQERRPWYERAISLLVQLQRAGQGGAPGDCIVFRRRFDPALLRWELDHFREWGLEAGLGVTLGPEEREVVDAAFDHIARQLAELPVLLVHRDFQSRNLLVQGERLRLIDFQDALMGPFPYDLVALLRDSYVELSPGEVEALLVFYLRERAAADLPVFQEEELRQAFYLQTLQRKLKDAGRFVFIDRVKGNPGFLRHIPASHRYVGHALAQLPEYRELADVLSSHVGDIHA